MFNLADKIFLGVTLLFSYPALLFTALVLYDFALTTVYCAYVFFSVRLMSSDCLYIKSIGYGVASAPIFIYLHVNDDTLGGKVSALEL